MKKVLVIMTSPRANSNSDLLAESFANGAKEAGNDVEVVSIKKKKINFCLACEGCHKEQKCVQKDAANEVIDKMKNADVIVFATPIYFYEMSGKLKTLLDRTYCLYGAKYNFKEIYLIATGGDPRPVTVKKAENGIKGWVDCYEKATFKKTIFCGGVTNPGEIKGNDKLKKAFEIGKKV